MKYNKIIILVIVLITALILYYFDIRFCPVFNLFHIPCPGCGMTRAFKRILEGKILESFKYNILMFPLLIIILFYIITVIINKDYILTEYINKHKKIVIIVSIIITIISWIINLFNERLY